MLIVLIFVAALDTASKSANGAWIACGVVAFVLAVFMVIIALVSVWLIKR